MHLMVRERLLMRLSAIGPGACRIMRFASWEADLKCSVQFVSSHVIATARQISPLQYSKGTLVGHCDVVAKLCTLPLLWCASCARERSTSGCKADGDVGSAMRKDGNFVQHARSLQQAGAKHQWGLQDFDLLVCVWDSVNFVPMLAASRSSRKVK